MATIPNLDEPGKHLELQVFIMPKVLKNSKFCN